MDLPFIPENGATSSIKPCQTEERGSFMPWNSKTRAQIPPPPAHTDAQVASSFMPLFIAIITRRERVEAGRSQAAFRPFEGPSSLSESQVFIELSLRRRPSKHADPPAHPAPLPAHFYAFVSLLCLYRFPPPTSLFPVYTYLSWIFALLCPPAPSILMSFITTSPQWQ